MTPTRRTFVLGGIGIVTLAACGDEPAGPGAITVSASVAAGANPGPDGSDRPLSLTLVQLRGADSFDAADVVALQDPTTTLAADLITSKQIVMAPNGSVEETIPVEQGAQVLGIVAGYRDPSGKTFRTTIPLPATGDVAVVITVTAAGLTIA